MQGLPRRWAASSVYKSAYWIYNICLYTYITSRCSWEKCKITDKRPKKNYNRVLVSLNVARFFHFALHRQDKNDVMLMKVGSICADCGRMHSLAGCGSNSDVALCVCVCVYRYLTWLACHSISARSRVRATMQAGSQFIDWCFAWFENQRSCSVDLIRFQETKYTV